MGVGANVQEAGGSLRTGLQLNERGDSHATRTASALLPWPARRGAPEARRRSARNWRKEVRQKHCRRGFGAEAVHGGNGARAERGGRGGGMVPPARPALAAAAPKQRQTTRGMRQGLGRKAPDQHDQNGGAQAPGDTGRRKQANGDQGGGRVSGRYCGIISHCGVRARIAPASLKCFIARLLGLEVTKGAAQGGRRQTVGRLRLGVAGGPPRSALCVAVAAVARVCLRISRSLARGATWASVPACPQSRPARSTTQCGFRKRKERPAPLRHRRAAVGLGGGNRRIPSRPGCRLRTRTVGPIQD